MRNRLAAILITTISILFSTSAHAQDIENNPELRSQIDHLFEHLEMDRVPSWLLMDYAIPLVNPARYTGTELTDSNYVDFIQFDYLYRTFVTAQVPPMSFLETPETYKQYVSFIQEEYQHVPICGLLFEYQEIREDALTEGLMQYTNGQVYDVYENECWKNPYQTRMAFAMAIPSVILSPSVTFEFDSQLFQTNMSYSHLECDFGDGYGYQLLNGVHDITYSPGDTCEIKFKVVFNDNTYLESHSLVYVMGEQLNSPMSTDEPTTIIHRDSVLYCNEWYRATISRADCQTSTAFEKPFIIVEGFDPKIGAYNNSTRLGNMYQNLPSNIKSDYDVLYIDWLDSEKSIRGNSQLLQQIITWINQQKQATGSTERNVIMGQSMGGLIARHALRKMEQAGTPHETRMYISEDAPHLGANLPLGAQYALRSLDEVLRGPDAIFNYGTIRAVANLFNSKLLEPFDRRDTTLYTGVSLFEDCINALNGAAAQEMSITYVTPNSIIDNTVHKNWQRELSNLGMPQGDSGFPIQNIAISNGGLQNNVVDAGGKLCSFEGNIKWDWLPLASLALLRDRWIKFLSFFSGNHSLGITVNIYPAVKLLSNKVMDFTINYTKEFKWRGPLLNNLYFAEKYTLSTQEVGDLSTPGSYYSLNVTADTATMTIWKYEVQHAIQCVDSVLFIPTASSLNDSTGLEINKNYYQQHFVENPSLAGVPFDMYMTNASTGESHINIGGNAKTFLSGIIDFEIEGPSYADTGAQYSIKDGVNDVTWTSSNTQIVTISGTGEITVVSPGFVTINATRNINGFNYTISRLIATSGGLSFRLVKNLPTIGNPTRRGVRMMPNSNEYYTIANQLPVIYKWYVSTVPLSSEPTIGWIYTFANTYDIPNNISDGTTCYVYAKVVISGTESPVYSITLYPTTNGSSSDLGDGQTPIISRI